MGAWLLLSLIDGRSPELLDEDGVLSTTPSPLIRRLRRDGKGIDERSLELLGALTLPDLIFSLLGIFFLLLGGIFCAISLE